MGMRVDGEGSEWVLMDGWVWVGMDRCGWIWINREGHEYGCE